MKRFIVLAGLFALTAVTGFGEQRIDIDLTNQRASLIDNGRILIDAPICSGRPGHETPTGDFRVTDKDRNHSSSLYGFFGNPITRQIVNPNADRDMRVPKGLEFVNAPMRYYVQFLPEIGLHAGYLPGHPDSHGCVRMPEEEAIRLFHAVSIGTPVHVHGEPEPWRQYWATTRFSVQPAAVVQSPARLEVARRGSGDPFAAEWDAKEREIDRQIADLQRRADRAQGGQRQAYLLEIQRYQDLKAGLNIRRDAARAALQRQIGG